MKINMPAQIKYVINKFTDAGYKAYIVGGCVRDSLLGLIPNDWDIATNALPNQIKFILSDCKIINTGIKHGTVTAVVKNMFIEITTFRTESAYSDNRHPDKVEFTDSLKEDLSRRDFTVNALAYNDKVGIVDCFGGVLDINNKKIRCVGNPDLRFNEDGLRILRALRFSSVLGFQIEKTTSQSILDNGSLLNNIACERINSEFTKLLCGNADSVLREYRSVVEQFIPEIKCMVGFNQHNPHHIFDIWEHTLKSVSSIKADPILRLTMLFHDIGKPHCFSKDLEGIGHFYGHSRISAVIANKVMKRLKYDNLTISTVTELIELHDLPLFADEKLVKRRLSRLGEKKFRLLLKVKYADTKALNPQYYYRLSYLKKIEAALNKIIKQNSCYSLKNLKINGKDLLSLNIPEGIEIGRMLSKLLDAVIDGKCLNEYDKLIEYAFKLKDDKNE